jgi:hypothetical protein
MSSSSKTKTSWDAAGRVVKDYMRELELSVRKGRETQFPMHGFASRNFVSTSANNL